MTLFTEDSFERNADLIFKETIDLEDLAQQEVEEAKNSMEDKE